MISGHEQAKAVFKEAIERNRLSHSYLLVGMAGVGKKTLARSLAQALNCDPPVYPGCGVCASCRKISAGNHADVITLERETQTIKIDQVRELASRLNYRPYEGRCKVAIIPEAERMTTHSMNALLKTLEEPPPDTVIILTTSNQERLLPTIVSRCQIIRLKPLEKAGIEEIISRELGIDHEQASILASLSEGSPGKALVLDRSFALEQRKDFIERLVSTGLDSPGNIFDFAKELAELRDNPEEVLDILAGFYRDVLWEKSGVNMRINIDLEQLVKAQAERLDVERILDKLDAIAETRTRIEGNANRLLAMEFLTMCLRGLQGAAMEAMI